MSRYIDTIPADDVIPALLDRAALFEANALKNGNPPGVGWNKLAAQKVEVALLIERHLATNTFDDRMAASTLCFRNLGVNIAF